jgi:hypothetical protein
MNLSHNFPELNQNQLKMLERIMSEREQQAIENYKARKNI